MQHVSNVVSFPETPKTSIRRVPASDDRLAAAITALHEHGPGLVCELWDRIETLETGSKDAAREAQALVDRLR